MNVVLGVLLLAGIGSNARGQQATGVSRPVELRVAAVQMRSARDMSANLRRIEEHLRSCAAEGARVVVFPECALSGYFDEAYIRGISAGDLEAAYDRIGKVCAELGVYAIVGTPYHEGDKLYNSAFVFDPRGKILEKYHKVQLAEKWPDGGDHLSVFPIDGVPCSIIVCHDERYPELVRLPVLAGARVVFYVSHESDLKSEHKIDPYRAQIQARAAENTVFVVQANAPANDDLTGSHGHSRIIGPDGHNVEEASIFGEDTVTATLELARATGNMSRGSLSRGFLVEWWKEGLKRVRMVEP